MKIFNNSQHSQLISSVYKKGVFLLFFTVQTFVTLQFSEEKRYNVIGILSFWHKNRKKKHNKSRQSNKSEEIFFLDFEKSRLQFNFCSIVFSVFHYTCTEKWDPRIHESDSHWVLNTSFLPLSHHSVYTSQPVRPCQQSFSSFFLFSLCSLVAATTGIVVAVRTRTIAATAAGTVTVAQLLAACDIIERMRASKRFQRKGSASRLRSSACG